MYGNVPAIQMSEVSTEKRQALKHIDNIYSPDSEHRNLKLKRRPDSILSRTEV